MTTQTRTEKAAGAKKPGSTKLLVAVGVGNALEWFDFAIYGLLAPQIARNFFPSDDPLSGLLATFAVLAVAFVSRPFGGILFGLLGDRRGRRFALSLAVVLMGAGTAAIGFLPTFAQVGILAPALLIVCRIIQGISAGGEYNTATTFVTEHAPDRRRGLHASVVSATVALSSMLGALASLSVLGWLNAAEADAFGWRIPFIIAGVISIVGLYMRLRLVETPVFMRHTASVEAAPAVRVSLGRSLRTHGRQIIAITAAAAVIGLVTYIYLGYMVSHLQVNLTYTSVQALTALLIGASIQLVAAIGFGRVIDGVNRRRWFLTASVIAIVVPIPLFAILPLGFWAPIVVMAVFGTIVASMSVSFNLLTTELLPTRIRVTGGAIAYNLAYAVFGGTAPFVATWLVQALGTPLAPAFYIVAAITALVIVLAFLLRDSRVESLSDLDGTDA